MAIFCYFFTHAYQPLVGIHAHDDHHDRRRDRLQQRSGGHTPKGEQDRREDGQE